MPNIWTVTHSLKLYTKQESIYTQTRGGKERTCGGLLSQLSNNYFHVTSF